MIGNPGFRSKKLICTFDPIHSRITLLLQWDGGTDKPFPDENGSMESMLL